MTCTTDTTITLSEEEEENQKAAQAKISEKGEKLRMHEQNLFSTQAKEEARIQVYLNEKDFEKARLNLYNHRDAKQHFTIKAYRALFGEDGYSSKNPNEDQKKELREIATRRGYPATKGLDTKHFHAPGAICSKYKHGGNMANDIENEHDLIWKLGHRLMWQNRDYDPFLSWSSSMLFVLVLGLARKAREEKYITVYSIDAEQAERGRATQQEYMVPTKRNEPLAVDIADEPVEKQGPAKFYFADRLLGTLDVAAYNGWATQELGKLTSDWFTHEYLTHGMVFTEKGSFKASLEILIQTGLFEFHPNLEVSEDDDQKRLYDVCVRARSLGFSVHDHAEAMTREELEGNSNLAACFIKVYTRQMGEDLDDLVPPLHIFLGFLGMKKRIPRDPLFMEWIKERYAPQDIATCGFDKTTSVANNLPEVLQTIALARDACFALGIPEIPATPVWAADPDFNFYGQWLLKDPHKINPRTWVGAKPNEPPNFDRDGMALSVVVKKNGWVVQREWKEEEDEDDGEGEEGMEVSSMEIQSTNVEDLDATGGDGEGRVSASEDVEMEGVEAHLESVRDDDEDEDVEMMEVTGEDMTIQEFQALIAPKDKGGATSSNGEEEDLMIASSGKQKPVEAEVGMEEEMALV